MKQLTDNISKISDLYAKRFDIDRTSDWYLLKLQEELGEMCSAYLKCTQRARVNNQSGADLKKNLEDEFADVLAMLLLFAKDQKIDPELAIKNKWYQHLEAAKDL